MTDQDKLLALLPLDGSPLSNGQLLSRLGWSKQKYFEAQAALVEEGRARRSRGRGGRLERVVNEDHAKMLSKVPADGASIGNITLRKKLRWAANRYWQARDELLDLGMLTKGGGKGGSVSRVLDEAAQDDHEQATPDDLDEAEEDDDDAPASSRKYVRESDLYPVIRKLLRTDWSREQRIHKCIVEVTAFQGRKQTGGKWTRPDLTLIGLREYPLTAQRMVDVVTFEVKLMGCWDISAVYEAYAQSMAATHSVLFLHTQDGDEKTPLLKKCETECAHLGLGLIVTTEPHSFEAWDVRVQPLRQNSDPDAVEEFLKTQVSPETLAQVRSWHPEQPR